VCTYIEERNGAMYVTASRVTLESIIYAVRRGESPEAIRTSFPSLTLEQIYGAITEYLANREQLDRYVLSTEAAWEEFARQNPAPPDLVEKLTRARQAPATRQ